MPEPDGFTGRQHLKSGDPENAKLRTLPPPDLVHIWFQYLDLVRDCGSNGFGVERLTYRILDAWANCQPVNRSPFKFAKLREIDRLVVSIRERLQKEQKDRDARAQLNDKAGDRHQFGQDGEGDSARR